MIVRILTALFTIPIYILALYFGGWIWTLFVSLLTVIATVEFIRMVGAGVDKKESFQVIIPLTSGLLLVIMAYLSHETFYQVASLVIFFSLFLCTISQLSQEQPQPLKKVGWVLFTILYIGFSFAHLVLLRNLYSGLMLTLLVSLLTWASDSSAYFVGVRFGKHKILPKVSPKKSIEGSCAGFLGSMIVGLLFGLFTDFGILKGVVLGLVISLSGQLGDFVASSIKRESSVKDTGTLLPGHGGIIDRFDSLLFSGVALYYIHLLLGGGR